MKSCVCILTSEYPAKQILKRLHDNYLDATHLVIESFPLRQAIAELHVIEADERHHPAILDEIAEFEETHHSLFRCNECESARLWLQYGGAMTHLLRSLGGRVLTRSLSRVLAPSLSCRSCRSMIEFNLQPK